MIIFKNIIAEICKENDLKTKYFCNDDWIIKISKNKKFTYLYSSLFESNNSATFKILKDKNAVYEILKNSKINSVEHFYFRSNFDNDLHFIDEIKDLLKTYKKIVIKDNEGSCGINVFMVEKEDEIEPVVKKILKLSQNIAVSPFYEIKHEYRVIVQHGKIPLIFDKTRAEICGDGISTVQQLISQKYPEIELFNEIDYNKILKPGEKTMLSWKHNLAFGSVPEIVTDEKLFKKLSRIALKSSKLLKASFVSVDIVDIKNKPLSVLEINGTVSLSKFASYSDKNYKLAKQIYLDELKYLLKF